MPFGSVRHLGLKFGMKYGFSSKENRIGPAKANEAPFKKTSSISEGSRPFLPCKELHSSLSVNATNLQPSGSDYQLWSELPPDVLICILCYLEPTDIRNCALTCKSWKAIFEKEALWRMLCLSRWNEIFEDSAVGVVNWKKNFIERSQLTETFHEFVSNLDGNGIINTCEGHYGVAVYSSKLGKGVVSDFISPHEVFVWTQNEPFAWFAVDFGPDRKIHPTHYTLRYGSSGDYCCPRNWLLQGTNDREYFKKTMNSKEIHPKDDPHWFTLSSHEDDTSLNSAFGAATWKLNLPKSKEFQIFRIVQIGKNKYQSMGLDCWSNVLVASGLEFYGFLREKKLKFQLRNVVGRTVDLKPTYDTNGIITALGGAKAVTTYASKMSRGSPSDFISRENVYCWTKNTPFSWFGVDFGNKMVSPTHYTLKYGSGGNYCCPRNWVLQGTNDPKLFKEPLGMNPADDYRWDTLSIHINDKTIDREFGIYTWILEVPRDKYYRCFRILQTGRNSYRGVKDEWSNVLVLSGFEIFGHTLVTPS